MRGQGVGYLAFGQFFVWAGIFYVFPATLIQWEESLGWARTEITGAFTLAILLSALCSPVAGRLIDRGQGAKLMVLSAVTGGFFLLGVSNTHELIWFYLWWAGIGIAFSGCLYEPCFALITRARGADAKNLILKVSLIAGFASTLSFPSAHFLSTNIGWRNTMQIFGLVVIFVAAPALYIGANRMENSASAQVLKRAHTAQSRAFLKNPIFWLSGIAFAWIALVHGMTLHHLLPLLREKGVTSTLAVTAASFIGPMQVIGRLIMVSTDGHVSNHRMMTGCFLALALSIIFLAGSGARTIMLMLFVLSFGSAYGMVSVLRPVIARDLLGESDYGAKSGVLASLYLTMSALAPYLGAILWHRGGYDLVLALTCLLAIVGLVFYVAANRIARQQST